MKTVTNTGGGGDGIIVQAAPSAVSLRGPTIGMRGTADIGISLPVADATIRIGHLDGERKCTGFRWRRDLALWSQ